MSSVSSINSLLSSSSTSASASPVNLSSLLTAATGATSTGIDVSAAVSAAIYAARAPERQWQSQQADLKAQIAALSSIQNTLGSVSSDLDDLNSPSGSLSATTVTSGNSSVVTATAAPGTATGTHVVTVNQLATSASWYSPAVTNATSSLGSSSLTITASDGTSTSFSLSSSSNGSLTSLAKTINGSSLGVSASVITDTTGSRLALVSSTTGAAADFSVSFNTTSSATFTSASLANSSTPLSASTFQLSDGASSVSIAVAAGSTLGDVANQINSQGLNLTASVVTDSSGAHLSVASSTSGTVSLSADPALAFTRASQGSNASLTVDGIPVSSATNQVSGSVSGLTLNLQGVTSGSQVTLAVSPNTSQISAAVSQFVQHYNSAISLVSTQFTFSGSSGSQGVLSGDGTIRSLQSMLLGVGAYSTGSGSSTSTLASLGITMGDDGTLTLNQTKLNQTIASNPTSVQNFFQGAALNGFAKTVQTQLKVFTSAATGTVATDMKSLNTEYTDLQSHIDDYESGYIASQRTVLTAMYSKAEIALQQLPATLKQLQAQLSNNSGN